MGVSDTSMTRPRGRLARAVVSPNRQDPRCSMTRIWCRTPAGSRWRPWRSGPDWATWPPGTSALAGTAGRSRPHRPQRPRPPHPPPHPGLAPRPGVARPLGSGLRPAHARNGRPETPPPPGTCGQAAANAGRRKTTPGNRPPAAEPNPQRYEIPAGGYRLGALVARPAARIILFSLVLPVQLTPYVARRA
jgi:hypothetical protein